MTGSPACLFGFLTHDPEHQFTKTKRELLKFQLAIEHYRKPSPEPPLVSFIHVECWGELAIEYRDKLKKGHKVEVRGMLKQDRWENAKDKVCSRIAIIADELIIK